tara:strand:- start:2546 stop:2875 length:330 start_codon:yes stop_codon:yes gene_type:complete
MPKISNNIIINNSELYDDFFDERGVNNIEHNSLGSLNLNFNPENYANTKHVWRKGDTLIRLANTYYRDFSYWYIIGYFNKKPIDSLYELGETIMIPSNPDNIRALIQRR